MVVRNDLDRFHLVADVIDRVPGLRERARGLRDEMLATRADSLAYAHTKLEAELALRERERDLGDVESLAHALAGLGVTRGDRVALIAENRYEWALTDLATLALGAVTVPIYPTLTAQQCRYILENSEAKVAVVSTPAQFDKISTAAEGLASLTTLVATPLGTLARNLYHLHSLAGNGRLDFSSILELLQADD